MRAKDDVKEFAPGWHNGCHKNQQMFRSRFQGCAHLSRIPIPDIRSRLAIFEKSEAARGLGA